jgi:glyoxylase-like metal-dependent hydrolase (beta-lactamase superfamily II)
MHRRLFIRSTAHLSAASLLGVGAPFVPRSTWSQNSSPGVFPLRDNLIQITGLGGNVVAAIDRDGVVLVDSGDAESSPGLIEVLGQQAGSAPVDVLLNTHWHVSHTGGNEAVRNASTRIVAHENTRLWMSTEFYVRWQDRTYKPRNEAALPTETFFSSDPQPLRLEAGGQKLEYAHLENAHTDGDIYVLFPDQNLIVTGGVVSVATYPTLDYSTGGWIDGLVSGLETLIGLSDRDTLIVPGRGPGVRRNHLLAQRDMASTLRDRVAENMRQGRGVDEMLALGITDDFEADWGQGNQGGMFVSNIYADLAWRGPGGAL